MPNGSPYTYVGNANAGDRTGAIYTSQGTVILGGWGYFLPNEYQASISNGYILVPGQSGSAPAPSRGAQAYLGTDGTIGGRGGSPLNNSLGISQLRGVGTIRNQAFPTAMSAPPTLTRYASTAALISAAAVYTNHRDYAPSSPVFRYLGANFIPIQPYQGFGITNLGPQNPAGFTGSSPANGWAIPARIEFETDATRFAWHTIGSSSFIRIWVNDQPHSLIPVTMPSPDFAETWLDVSTIGAAGTQKRVVIESEGLLGDGAMVHAGILVPPTAEVWAPTTLKGSRVIVVGDSLEAGYPGPANNEQQLGYIFDAFRLLGFSDIWMDAISGTGYLVADGLSTFGGRLVTDVLPFIDSTSIVMFCGSINDQTSTDAQIAAAATTAWQSVQATGAFVIASGPFRSNVPTARDLTQDTALATAAAALGIPFISRVQPTDGSWATGTGTTASTTGNGNGDIYSLDHTHMNPAGQHYQSRRMAGALEMFIPQPWMPAA